MLKLTDEGYTYISEAGHQYDVLEGITIGGVKKCTSDMIFIMFTDCDYNLDNFFVGYLFGAICLADGDQTKDYEQSIKEMVDEFETKNGIR